jgi:TolB-like protein/DNA-binding winged helix-turn-helix (wHTH) protein/tetratricopeptide (TPR) repeat protein
MPRSRQQLEHGFMLGELQVRPDKHCVLKNGRQLHIEPKSMSVLMELATHSEETVSRDDLISSVWPRGFVSDDVLNRCISQLRHAFDDDPRNPDYILTVPRRGYRLVAPVVARARVLEGGILVMPFQNLAARGKDEYLADGLTELLIARLAVASDSRVISRTTSMTFKGNRHDIKSVRESLGVKWVIEGSLLQLGSQLQVVVQLIDAETDAHTWADTWTRPIEDVMSVLNEISRQISIQIQTNLEEGQEKPGSVIKLPGELMRRFLQGTHLASRRTAENLRKALLCFEEVLKEAPDHAPAMAGIALCHILLVHYGAETAQSSIPVARQYAQRALEIDPQNAEALSHLGAIRFYFEWDFQSAADLTQQALELKPQFELAMILAASVNLVNGNYEKSQSMVDRAIATDPLNIGILMNAGDLLILQRRYGEAINCLSQSLELQGGFRPALLRLALAQALHGQPDSASESLQKAKDMGGEDSAYWEYRALITGQTSQYEDSHEAAEKLQALFDSDNSVLPWSLARAWAAAGEAEKAVTFLQKAFDEHSSSMPFLGQTPVFETVRTHSTVRQIMKDTGLPV